MYLHESVNVVQDIQSSFSVCTSPDSLDQRKVFLPEILGRVANMLLAGILRDLRRTKRRSSLLSLPASDKVFFLLTFFVKLRILGRRALAFLFLSAAERASARESGVVGADVVEECAGGAVFGGHDGGSGGGGGEDEV